MKLDLRYRPGWRAGKTAIAVALAMVYVAVFDREALLAPVNSILCLLPTGGESVKLMRTRLVSTMLGGLLGCAAIQIGTLMPGTPFLWYVLVLPLTVLLDIYLCNVLRIQEYLVYSAVIILVVALNYDIHRYEPLFYTLGRLLDTAVGAAIATAVNLLIHNPGRNRPRPDSGAGTGGQEEPRREERNLL